MDFFSENTYLNDNKNSERKIMNYKSIKEDLLSVIPNFEDLAEILSDANSVVSMVNKTQKMIVKNKIQTFIRDIETVSHSQINDFCHAIKDDENQKVIFIEAINKVIDLDDEVQIYILAMLVNQYKANNQLNYYEKSLYYNINQLSKDDFAIYYCFYSSYILGNEKTNSFYVNYEIVNQEIVEIVLRKFISFGILKDKTSENSLYIGLCEYSPQLFEYLSLYFKQDDICNEYLPVDKEKNKMQRIKMSGY